MIDEQRKIFIGLITLIIFFFLAFIALVLLSPPTSKMENFCEERGYNSSKRIDGHFNCCNNNVEVVNEKYEVVEDCIAGGTIEGLR